MKKFNLYKEEQFHEKLQKRRDLKKNLIYTVCSIVCLIIQAIHRGRNRKAPRIFTTLRIELKTKKKLLSNPVFCR